MANWTYRLLGLIPPDERCADSEWFTVQTVHAIGFRMGGPHTVWRDCDRRMEHGGMHESRGGNFRW